MDEGNKASKSETITIEKKVVEDLLRVKEEFDSIVESLELMADEEFMESYRLAKEQIKRREFEDWEELTKHLR